MEDERERERRHLDLLGRLAGRFGDEEETEEGADEADAGVEPEGAGVRQAGLDVHEGQHDDEGERPVQEGGHRRRRTLHLQNKKQRKNTWRSRDFLFIRFHNGSYRTTAEFKFAEFSSSLVHLELAFTVVFLLAKFYKFIGEFSVAFKQSFPLFTAFDCLA